MATNLLNEHGLENIAAAIAAALRVSRQIGDKAATLYQWLAELRTGANLRYVGVTHIIRKFGSETRLLIGVKQRFAKFTITSHLKAIPRLGFSS